MAMGYRQVPQWEILVMFVMDSSSFLASCVVGILDVLVLIVVLVVVVGIIVFVFAISPSYGLFLLVFAVLVVLSLSILLSRPTTRRRHLC